MKTSNAVKRLNSQLARQNARVDHFLDSFLQGVDAVADAARENKWENVIQHGQELARDCRENGLDELGNAADNVIAAAYSPENMLEVRRSVIKLIGAGGRMPVINPQPRDAE